MFTNHINRIRSTFIAGVVVALIFSLPSSLFARRVLTVQPWTGNVGIGATSPTSKLDVRGGEVNIDGSGVLQKESDHWLAVVQ
jgi:hypothetical protein